MYKVLMTKAGECEVLLYGEIMSSGSIGEWISAKKLITELKSSGDISRLNLRINSDGGSVFEALTMYNYMKGLKCRKYVYIDGIAASAASVVAMCGDVVVMPANTMMMLHNPLSVVMGNAEELREQAEILDKLSESTAGVYSVKTGKPVEEIRKLMDAESWLTAQECLEFGLCDRVIDAVKSNASVEGEPHVEGLMTREQVDAEIAQAVQAERKRIQALDGLTMPGFESEIQDAKYTTLKEAREIAYEMLTSEKFRGMSNHPVYDFGGMNLSRAHNDYIESAAEYVNNRRRK